MLKWSRVYQQKTFDGTKRFIGMKKGFMAAVLCAVLLCSGVSVSAETTQQKLQNAKKQASESQSQLSTVQDRISELESKKSEAEAYLSDLNSQVGEINDQISDLEKKYADKQKELDDVSLELEEAKEDEQKQRDSMKLRIKYMYENSTSDSMLEAVLSAEDFADLLNRPHEIEMMTSYDRKMLNKYADAVQTVQKKEAQVKKEEEEISSLKADTEKKKTELQQLLNQTSVQVNTFAAGIADQQSTAAQLAAKLQQQNSQVQSLTKQAEEEVAAADAAAKAAAAKQAAAKQAATQQAASTASKTSSSSGSGSSKSSSSAGSSSSSKSGGSSSGSYSYNGTVLTKAAGTIMGPSGKETYYNMDMSGVVQIMRNMGYTGKYWVRSDGVKMLGDYVMVAANLNVRPRGTVLPCSLGMAIVCDTGGFALHNKTQLDIAVNW